MDIGVIFVFIIFLVVYGFYVIHIFLPKYKKLKYLISLTFAMIGLFGWILVWVGVGWLITGIVSSAFIILSGLSLVIAFSMDLITHIKAKNLK